MYSEVTNLVPFLSSNSGGRSILATAQMVQAVPLKDREAPLVRSGNLEESKAFSLGQRSPVDGVVTRVQKTHIKVRARGTGKIHTVPVFENMPLNRGSLLHSYPLVRTGDEVKKGQLLADNNFAQGGMLAIDRNLNTAIMPWLGYGHEDGIVISDAAAKSLTSEHLYDLSKTLDSRMQANPSRFTTYGKKYKIDAENWAQLDRELGIIKPVAIIKKADVLATIPFG